MKTKTEEAVKQMGECYLEWSRALSDGASEVVLEALLTSAATICYLSENPAETLRLHYLDRDRLTALRKEERFATIKTEIN